MDIISNVKIEEYCRKYPNARNALLTWYDHITRANYKKPQDVQEDWGPAVIVRKLAIFNIKGKHYRLIAKINYEFQIVKIEWFGTHAQYNRIDIDRL